MHRVAWQWLGAAWVALGVLSAGSWDSCAQEAWRPAPGPLLTRWGARLQPDQTWTEYPRPQMRRARWQNLNGLWELAITSRQGPRPKRFPHRVLVPFAVESRLSGLGLAVRPDQVLWYRRSFSLQKRPGHRVLLHFGAVDWEAQVWVNGHQVGKHRGGYDPFWMDITEALGNRQEHELVVRVWDPTDSGYQPRGKQTLRPRGIWYTAVSGIWQTVWLEQVPPQFIRRLKITPKVPEKSVEVIALVHQGQHCTVQVQVLQQDQVVAQGITWPGKPLRVSIPHPRLWSPEDPFLYDLKVTLLNAQAQVVDQVESYFGMRQVGLVRDSQGRLRLGLNGKPLFQFGPLDQGWWPEGLYTPPSDQAMLYDLQVVKRLGMNMIRKHVKVEPQRWYYHCDRLGILVWQDMPNGDRHIGRRDPDLKRSPESAQNFRQELQAVVDALYNHPCVVMWVPFNEGWGQFDTAGITRWLQQYDPTRLVNSASGWTDRGTGHVLDIHAYPGPAMPPLESRRAVVLGEFGGLGWPVPGHLWTQKRNWGYRTYHSQEELQRHFDQLMQRLLPLVSRGLAAAVYTQLTDVETEVNGLMTYDRAVLKVDEELVRRWAQRLYREGAPAP